MWGGGDYITIATLSPPDDLCIKAGSDESHFNASLVVRFGLAVTGKALGWPAEGPWFEFASALLSLQKL